MCNLEIRNEMRSRGVRQWQVAEYLNIPETTFSKMMRHDLDPDKANEVMEAIDQIVANSAQSKINVSPAFVVNKGGEGYA